MVVVVGRLGWGAACWRRYLSCKRLGEGMLSSSSESCISSTSAKEIVEVTIFVRDEWLGLVGVCEGSGGMLLAAVGFIVDSVIASDFFGFGFASIFLVVVIFCDRVPLAEVLGITVSDDAEVGGWGARLPGTHGAAVPCLDSQHLVRISIIFGRLFMGLNP